MALVGYAATWHAVSFSLSESELSVAPDHQRLSTVAHYCEWRDCVSEVISAGLPLSAYHALSIAQSSDSTPLASASGQACTLTLFPSLFQQRHAPAFPPFAALRFTFESPSYSTFPSSVLPIQDW